MGKKKSQGRGEGGVDWRGREEALDKHDFFPSYLLAGEGLDFLMS